MLRNKSVILDINILFLDFNYIVYIALFLMKKQEFYNHKKPRKLLDQVRYRLTRLAGRRITEHGVLIIEARRFRKQEGNRQDAIDCLIKLIQKVSEKPKPRRKLRGIRSLLGFKPLLQGRPVVFQIQTAFSPA